MQNGMFGVDRVARFGAVFFLALLAACGGGSGGPSIPAQPAPPVATPAVPQISGMQRIGTDIFSNADSQHATVVEPSILAAGGTVVAAYQAGRFISLGASDIAMATSRDGGVSWVSSTMPAATLQSTPLGGYNSVSDPAVAYDAAHATWIVSAAAVQFGSNFGPAAVIGRSSDGVIWSNAATFFPNQNLGDKPWIACDNTPASAFFGHCYLFWDEAGANMVFHASVSVDGGASWSPQMNIPGNASGIDAQPVIQPNGKVVVSADDNDETHILAFTSSDGGQSWSSAVTVSQVFWHGDPGPMRAGPFVGSAVDNAGTIYDVWSDCRFRTGCGTNDIVMSTSHDGLSWSAPTRLPLDSGATAADFLLPAIAVDPQTGGAGAHLAVSYYTFPAAPCAPNNCRLFAGFTTSPNGGASWTISSPAAGPMGVGSLAHTQLGAMVGDYLALTFSGGHVIGLAAVAFPPAPAFDEALYATLPGSVSLSSATRNVRAERMQTSLRPQRPVRPGP